MKSQLTIFRAYEINGETIRNPAAFGFTNMKEPCFAGTYRGSFYEEKKYCPDAFAYKYWDYVHPNSMMHCYYAARFVKDLKNSVQEEFLEDKAQKACLSLSKKGISVGGKSPTNKELQ